MILSSFITSEIHWQKFEKFNKYVKGSLITTEALILSIAVYFPSFVTFLLLAPRFKLWFDDLDLELYFESVTLIVSFI